MTQDAFTQALLDPKLPVPEGLVDPQGRPAARRFDIYRNNVASSLTDVLVAAFPAVVRLVGDAFFRAMALEFLRAHHPRTRILMLYGAEFPAFLQSFPPVAHLGYLPDVARLEQALREAYHAADAGPVDGATLAALPADRLMQTRLILQPALRLIRSPWPVHSIWRATLENGASPEMAAQDVLVTRRGFDVAPHLLPRGGGAFMTALLAGETFESALNSVDEEFDLQQVFGMLLTAGAIVGTRG